MKGKWQVQRLRSGCNDPTRIGIKGTIGRVSPVGNGQSVA